MLVFVIRRIIQMAPVILIMSLVTFFITSVLPGDVTTAILGDDATVEQRENLREQLGLNDSLPVQYLRWLGGAVTGDFGNSLRSQHPVIDLLLERAPVTIELTILSILMALLLGIPAGILSATYRNSHTDTSLRLLAVVGVAIPNFWLGILLILLFSLQLGLLPPSGYVPFFADPIRSLTLMIMPAFSLALGLAAVIMRQTRASLLEVMSQDYIRTAKAKGLAPRKITFKHALRNGLIPVITVTGLQIGGLMNGAVITEVVFSLPGVGRLAADAIFTRDLPLLQGAIVVIAISVLVVNLLTDITYALVDPRIKLTAAPR